MLRRREVLGALCAGAVLWHPAVAAPPRSLELEDGDRLLVLACHPDDETLAAGGLIQEALALGTPVRVCFATQGDNDEIAALFTRRHPSQMPGPVRAGGTRRRNEAGAAAAQLGLAAEELVFLGYPDPGLLDIWHRHWRTVPPFRSPLTRANAVSYSGALTPGSAYAGEDLLDDLAEVLRDFRPTLIVAPHPADHDPDHRALYLFLRVALWDLADAGPPPRVLSAPGHFTRWPRPRAALPGQPAVPPDFLPEGTAWQEYSLAPYQVTNKLAALRRHHTQFQAAAPSLLAFIRKSEWFGTLADDLLPGGVGTANASNEDPSRFRPDPAELAEWARSSDAWQAVAAQSAAETAAVGARDNRILEHFLSGDGSTLTCSFLLERPLAPEVTATLRIFGHRPGTGFGEMPKLAITATPGRILAVTDLDRELSTAAVEAVPGGDDEITVRVPYALLGRPTRLLIGADLQQGPIPVDWIPWRAIDLRGPEAAPVPAPEAPEAQPARAAPGPAAPAPAVRLVPRVELPRPPARPPRREADEPVLW